MFLGKGSEHFECQCHVVHKLNLKYIGLAIKQLSLKFLENRNLRDLEHLVIGFRIGTDFVSYRNKDHDRRKACWGVFQN